MVNVVRKIEETNSGNIVTDTLYTNDLSKSSWCLDGCTLFDM